MRYFHLSPFPNTILKQRNPAKASRAIWVYMAITMLKQTKLGDKDIVERMKEISAELKGEKKPNPKSLAVTDLSLQDVGDIFSIAPMEKHQGRARNFSLFK